MITYDLRDFPEITIRLTKQAMSNMEHFCEFMRKRPTKCLLCEAVGIYAVVINHTPGDQSFFTFCELHNTPEGMDAARVKLEKELEEHLAADREEIRTQIASEKT